MKLFQGIAGGALILTLASCVTPVGPKHTPPDARPVTPTQWSWQPARPVDHLPKGEWWRIFNDTELDTLVSKALTNSPNVQAAVARVEQARARARASTINFYPDIRFNPALNRQRTSGNLPTPVPVTIPSAQINSFSVPFDLSYEIDLWGKVRRTVESARASAAATASDYHQLLLTLAADVAIHHFTRRALDTEIHTLRHSITLREQQLRLLEQRAMAGTLSETDVARARTELASARADLADATRLRKESADSLALVCGAPAGQMDLPENPLGNDAPPAIPPGIPADVLERRPDVAAAERLVASRNADIGTATAAYFPSLRLTGEAGFLSRDLDSLFSADSRTWSFGPSLSLPITGYGVIGARVRLARAAHEEAIAQFRQVVLSAVRDVETSLAQVRFRAEQSAALSEALTSATLAEDLVRQRHERGLVSQLELIDAERTRLLVELRRSQSFAQQHIASIRLIKALGGGW